MVGCGARVTMGIHGMSHYPTPNALVSMLLVFIGTTA